MKEISLNTRVGNKHRGKYVAFVDDEDYERINQYRWHIVFARAGGVIYAARFALTENGHGSTVYMHKEVMRVNGKQRIDHADRNGLNCQKHNLRLCTMAQNNCNRIGRAATRKSKYKGVSVARNKWMTRVQVNGKIVYYKCFDFEDDAALAYNENALKYHGEFARLNVVEK